MNALRRSTIAALLLILANPLWAQSNDKTDPGGGIGGTGYTAEQFMDNMSANAPTPCRKAASVGSVDSVLNSTSGRKKGDLICAGTLISTTSAERLTVMLNDGTRIALADSTQILINSKANAESGLSGLRLKLESGKIRLQSASNKAKQVSMQVLIPTRENIVVLVGADTEIAMASPMRTSRNDKPEFYIRAITGNLRLIAQNMSAEILEGNTAELSFENDKLQIKQHGNDGIPSMPMTYTK